MYSVYLSPSANDFYKKAAKPLAKKIKRCFEILEKTPKDHPRIKSLKGKLKGRLRYALGDHRIVYTIVEESQSVNVSVIAPRGSVYRVAQRKKS